MIDPKDKAQIRKDAVEAAAKGRLDANETAFFLRELETIEARTYDVLYPDCKARQLIPMGTGLSPAASYLTWRQFDKVGFDPDSMEATMDTDVLPQVEIVGSETTSEVQPIVVGYGYTIQDIREAQMMNRPLDAMKAAAARDFVERKIELMAAKGAKQSAENLIYGLLNQPNVAHINPVTGSTAGYTDWAAAASTVNTFAPGGYTPKEIIRNLNSARNQVVTKTNGVHNPDTLILDLASYTYLDTTQVNDADASIFTEGTILSYIMRNLSWLKKVDSWIQCNSAGSSLGATKARSLLMEKNDTNFAMFIPQEFEQFAPQLHNFKFNIPCHARFGGVVCRYPKSAVYLDGLQA